MASAQSPAPPAPIPQDQFDALVKAITQSVLEKLKAEGSGTPKRAEEKRNPFDVEANQAPDDVTLFFRQAGHVMSVGVPALITSFDDFGTALNNSPRGGLGRFRFFLLILATVVAAVSLEAALRWLTSPAHDRLAAKSAATFGVRSLVSLVALAAIDFGDSGRMVASLCKPRSQIPRQHDRGVERRSSPNMAHVAVGDDAAGAAHVLHGIARPQAEDQAGPQRVVIGSEPR